jgi:inorganic pyrophosphatase
VRKSLAPGKLWNLKGWRRRGFPPLRADQQRLPARTIAALPSEKPMSLHNVTPGAHSPDEFNVIIEIPMNADPIKYEVDKKSGAMFVDRFMSTAMRYPCNYGYVPQTLSDDGDPVDVLVITPFPLAPGVVVTCRPIGMLRMEDEAGVDAKLLAVPIDKILPIYRHWQKPEDMNELRLRQIQHFFEHYKDLEPGKWVKTMGWDGPDAAREEIRLGIASYARSGGAAGAA